MRLYIVDYQIPRSDNLDCIVIDAEDMASAELKAIEELKTLHIPKRYIVKIEEVL